jgi:hypothetical protein
MVSSVPFVYGSYYKLCQERGTPCEDVFGYIFTADYRAMKAIKYSGEDLGGAEQPFLTRNMVARRLDAADPILATPPADLAPLGGYGGASISFM